MTVERQVKKSKLLFGDVQSEYQYKVDLDKDVYNLFREVDAITDQFNGGTFTYTYVYLSSDVYWHYNPVTHYLEGWVEGVKRMEI